jgi:hypothetical protein
VVTVLQVKLVITMTTTNQYSVCIWNLEKVYAKSEAEAVAIIKNEFYEGLYRRRDFEFDDAELVDNELTDADLAEWNSYKSEALYPTETLECEEIEATDDGDEEEYLVIIIGSVYVEAENEEQAEENACECFYHIKKENFEVRISG